MTRLHWRLGILVVSTGMSGLVAYSARHWSPTVVSLLCLVCWFFGYIDCDVDHALKDRDQKRKRELILNQKKDPR